MEAIAVSEEVYRSVLVLEKEKAAWKKKRTKKKRSVEWKRASPGEKTGFTYKGHKEELLH